MLGHQLVVHEVGSDYRAVDYFNPVGASLSYAIDTQTCVRVDECHQ